MTELKSSIKRLVLFAFLLANLSTGSALATDFAWIEDAQKLERGDVTLSVGGAFYNSAPFPYSGLDGNLYEAPWVALRYSVSDNAQFYFNGALRKTITVDAIDSALKSPELEQPVMLDQSRSATGDFSVYSKIRFPLFAGKADLGIVTGFTMPNTNTTSGLGLDRSQIHGRVILASSVGKLRLVANSGIAIIENTTGTGQDDFFTYGFGVAIKPLTSLELHGELYGIDGPPDGSDDGLFDSLNVALGASVITKQFTFDLTAKGFFKEPSPSSAVFIRFSHTFHLGRK